MCSAAEMTVDSGAFATTMPRRVAASTSTLSTPTPARPITFSRIGALDQPGVELRRGADDDRVVVADRGGEVAVRVHVDVEPVAKELDPGLGDRLPDREPSRGLVLVRLERARHGDARSMSAPASASASSIPASAVVMSKTSKQPMWPIRRPFP